MTLNILPLIPKIQHLTAPNFPTSQYELQMPYFIQGAILLLLLVFWSISSGSLP